MSPKQPTVTTRRYIRWATDPATEPTTTLVLTSPAGHFVDIRVLLPETTKVAGPLPLPLVRPELLGVDAVTHETHARAATTGVETLDWAFAGLASTSAADDEGKQKCKWEHWVDNRTARAWEVMDAGVMKPVKEIGVDDADVEWEIETGSMPSASHNNEVTAYEEGWLPLSPLLEQQKPPHKIHSETKTDGGVGAGLKLLPPETSIADERICIVLATRSLKDAKRGTPAADSGEATGMVVRMGDWCQGVLRTGDGTFEAVRCVRLQGTWKTLVHVVSGGAGQADTRPLRAAVERVCENAEAMKAEDEVGGISGLRWEVMEKTSW